MPRDGQQTGDKTDEALSPEPGESVLGGAGEFVRGTPVLPADHVIVTPWAPDSVGSPQIVCCFPSKLPGWSPGEAVLPALPPQPPRLSLFLCTTLLCSNSDGCW